MLLPPHMRYIPMHTHIRTYVQRMKIKAGGLPLSHVLGRGRKEACEAEEAFYKPRKSLTGSPEEAQLAECLPSKQEILGSMCAFTP